MVTDIVTQVFNGTEQLIRECDRKFMEKMWENALLQRKARFLNFLCVLLEQYDHPIKINQVPPQCIYSLAQSAESEYKPIV
jgi:hypothetical protein